VGDNPVSDTMNTENNSEMTKEIEERKLPRTSMDHHFLKMWQGSQNIRATPKDTRAQHKQMTAVGYILAPEEIIKAPWSLFQHDGAAAFKLSERSPLPPVLSANDLPEGHAQILNVCQIWKIDHLSVGSDQDSVPEGISETENWLNWNRDLNNPNDSEDNFAADDEADIEHNNGFDGPACPVQQDVSAVPTVPGLVWPTPKSKRQPQQVLVTVNAIETRRNKAVKKMYDRMRQWFTSFFM